MELNVWLFINIISDAANYDSDNMIEKVNMVEVETELNHFDELFSVCKNTSMVTNHSIQDSITSESKNNTSI